MVTICLTSGYKITGEIEKIAACSSDDFKRGAVGMLPKGMIAVNVEHIVMVREATEGEAEHYKIHGY